MALFCGSSEEAKELFCVPRAQTLLARDAVLFTKLSLGWVLFCCSVSCLLQRHKWITLVGVRFIAVIISSVKPFGITTKTNSSC